MARSDRLFRLLDALRRLPKPVTAARLAAETEVSERTLYRDIETLRAGGALIDGAAGFGYTLTEDPALPPQMFSRLEIEALVLGLAEVRQAGDPALALAAEVALAKITATLPERVQRQAIHAVQETYRFQRPAPAPENLPVIRQACWDEMMLEIDYRDKDGSLTKRQILPLSIVFFDRAMMVLAWCRLRQDYRRFHLQQTKICRSPAPAFDRVGCLCCDNSGTGWEIPTRRQTSYSLSLSSRAYRPFAPGPAKGGPRSRKPSLPRPLAQRGCQRRGRGGLW